MKCLSGNFSLPLFSHSLLPSSPRAPFLRENSFLLHGRCCCRLRKDRRFHYFSVSARAEKNTWKASAFVSSFDWTHRPHTHTRMRQMNCVRGKKFHSELLAREPVCVGTHKSWTNRVDKGILLQRKRLVQTIIASAFSSVPRQFYNWGTPHRSDIGAVDARRRERNHIRRWNKVKFMVYCFILDIVFGCCCCHCHCRRGCGTQCDESHSMYVECEYVYWQKVTTKRIVFV